MAEFYRKKKKICQMCAGKSIDYKDVNIISKYITEKGNVKRIDYINRFIKFTDNKKIILDDVIDIKINE